MGKKSRPPGGRPRGRRDRGGVGPGPAYRPSSTGGGTRHNTGGCMLAKVVGATILAFIAAATIGTFAAMVAA